MALGLTAPCTCFARGSDGTRIDAIFCNAALAPSLRGVALVEDTGIPTHIPVIVDLALETYGQRVRRIARPLPFVPKEWAKMDARGGVRRCLAGAA